MDFETIKARIDQAQDKARFFVTQRRKDTELYAMIADCMSICEDALALGITAQIKEDVISKSSGNKKGRVYFEHDSDIYLIVGRHVFSDSGQSRKSAKEWRYIASMREAAKRGYSSSEIEGWLRSNGGINALFMGRPNAFKSKTRKTLHLNSSVTFPISGEFTLTLRMDNRGFFDVVHVASQMLRAA